MPNLDPNQTIVLFIDIDDTLIVKGTSDSDFEFCGSTQMNDATHWISLLTRLQEKCSALGVLFMVQIVTAKVNIDCTVDAVATHLHSFLKPIGMKENNVDDIPKQYMAMFHLHHKITTKRCDNAIIMGTERVETIQNNEILPSIHVCQKNGPDGHTSKANVMETINLMLGGIPGEQLFLLDDSDGWAGDLLYHNKGYQFISANSLKANTQSAREMAFQTLQADIDQRIMTCVTSIKRRSQASEFNGCRTNGLFCEKNHHNDGNEITNNATPNCKMS